MSNSHAPNPPASVKQERAALIRKVTAGGFAGAIATIGGLGPQYLLPASGKPIPAEIAAAITTVLSFTVS